ncbi:hypothetical protein Mpal_0168 [Methanosphaerula palustris E1-9c]|uniref:Uncharacterized protein n=1 Tax=Methanosphaerula palustris (strain ATCC BAA-1556 / DSM 19958 / E1-9c) TaxID=521011 RepID=B8GIY8_METPE|nr:hypothetical protein Mpal_0168 [Methanosphaerula palustris E1-9c]
MNDGNVKTGSSPPWGNVITNFIPSGLYRVFTRMDGYGL